MGNVSWHADDFVRRGQTAAIRREAVLLEAEPVSTSPNRYEVAPYVGQRVQRSYDVREYPAAVYLWWVDFWYDWAVACGFFPPKKLGF